VSFDFEAENADGDPTIALTIEADDHAAARMSARPRSR